jgi:GNAT superfamily N-acetyltransferase
VQIRALRRHDRPAVHAIYEAGIATGNATFETTAPAWQAWDAAHLPGHRPVAVDGGRVLAWTALAPVSDRCAYAGVAEDSIYVAPEAQGRGVGRARSTGRRPAARRAHHPRRPGPLAGRGAGRAPLPPAAVRPHRRLGRPPARHRARPPPGHAGRAPPDPRRRPRRPPRRRRAGARAVGCRGHRARPRPPRRPPRLPRRRHGPGRPPAGPEPLAPASAGRAAHHGFGPVPGPPAARPATEADPARYP